MTSEPANLTTACSYNWHLQRAAAFGNVLASYDYAVRADGQRMEVLEEHRNADNSTFSTTRITWAYDDLNRLTEETRDENDDGQNDAGDYVTDYCFDLAGNRVKMTIDCVGTVSDEVVTYSYTDPVTALAGNDRLYRETRVVDPAGSQTTTVTDYTYDANGSQLTKGSDSFTWDLRNRMIEATVDGTTTTYGYEDQGQRISFASEGVTTYLVNDWSNPTDYPQVLEEKVGTAPDTATLSRTYAIGLRMEGQFDSNGAAFFLRDGHGSDRALLDDGGNVIRCFDYQAFGEAIGFDPAAAGTIQLFAGDGEFDAVSKLYYRDARWGESCRFISGDGWEYGDTSNPITLNAYLYANANPIRFGDPSGHWSLVEMTFAIGAGIAIIGFATMYIGIHTGRPTVASVGQSIGQFGVTIALAGPVGALIKGGIGVTVPVTLASLKLLWDLCTKSAGAGVRAMAQNVAMQGAVDQFLTKYDQFAANCDTLHPIAKLPRAGQIVARGIKSESYLSQLEPASKFSTTPIQLQTDDYVYDFVVTDRSGGQIYVRVSKQNADGICEPIGEYSLQIRALTAMRLENEAPDGEVVKKGLLLTK